MTDSPVVSIVVPVFNVEKYLQECISSLASQTHRSVEIILVDDGSSDKSGAICDTFAASDARVRVIHQNNKGVSAARNAGLKVVTGDYVMFVDADDTLAINAVELLVSVAVEGQQDVVSAGTNRVVKNADPKPAEGSLVTTSLVQPHVLVEFLKNRTGLSASARLYARTLLEGIGFDESIRINEDKLYLYHVFSRASEHMYINANIYNYRQHSDSASHRNFSGRFFAIEHVADSILQDVTNSRPDIERVARVQAVRSYIELYTRITLSSSARHKYADDYKRLQKKIYSSGLRRLDSFLSTFRLWVICYMPPMYILLSYVYNEASRRKGCREKSTSPLLCR